MGIRNSAEIKNMMNALEKAIALAVEAHTGQLRKDGSPYILHPLHLMLQMQTESEMITAVLHDVVEDSRFTLADLERMGFEPEVITAVALLTHDTDVPYERYIQEIKANPLACRVKLADLEHNMDIRALPELNEKAWQRLQRYGRAWAILQT